MPHRLATGFEGIEGEYDRGRPEYPPAVAGVLGRAIGLGAGRRVLDLAAGTGKLTRLLRSAGAHVVAVEPLEGMRARLRADEVLAGSAEDIPLADASVDAAVVGDAWHWFDAPAAADELARVVRPGGGAALLWQRPAERGGPEWAEALGPLLGPLIVDHPAFRDEGGRGALDRHPGFDGLTEHQVPFTWRPSREEYLSFARSWSFVAVLPAPRREELMARMAEIVPDAVLEIAYVTHVWTTRRTTP